MGWRREEEEGSVTRERKRHLITLYTMNFVHYKVKFSWGKKELDSKILLTLLLSEYVSLTFVLF